MKPWIHAVVLNDGSEAVDCTQELTDRFLDNDSRDIVVRIECRNKEGNRYPKRDLELEIFRSGKDMNLILSWCNRPDCPLLWQGSHSVWMDSNSGKRCSTPRDGIELESLARRLQAFFV